jgi:RNA-directed DNA polymerase
MKESYRKDLANHPGPEPCEGDRKAALEALDRGICRLGIELRNKPLQDAHGVGMPEGNMVTRAIASAGPTCGVEDPMHAEKLQAREPGDPVVARGAGRRENAMSGKSFMNDDGESYCGIGPAKQPNKGDGSPAEVAEERPQTKENTQQPNLDRTPSRKDRPSGLERVREAARKEGNLKFTALLHHVSIDLLRDSYFSLKKQAAPGVDGMTWEEYGRDLEARITDLHGRIHRGAYRAQPSRRVWIPKADGRQRPLGIAALEDKIVQYAVGTVLNQIWEEDFLGFSYGFRPGRSQHDALDALWVGIVRKRVNWILDLDIRSFLDTASYCPLIHEVLSNRLG